MSNETIQDPKDAHASRKPRKEDRRVARSKAALHQALNELVMEKGFEKLTVEEITERANLGRTTFYLHYRDKEDLFLDDFDSRLNQIVDEMDGVPLRQWFVSRNGEIMLMILQMVEANADVFRVIVHEQSNQVYNRFRDIVAVIAERMVIGAPLFKKRSAEIKIPLDLIYNYFAGSMWATIVWWVEHDFQPSAEEMNGHFRKMFFFGLLGVLDVKNPEMLNQFI